MAEDTAQRPNLARNPISWVGLVVAGVSLANIIFLIVAGATGAHTNPYLGILTWMVLPAFLTLGLILFVLGILLERRRRRKIAPDEHPPFPRLDLNSARVRRTAIISFTGILLFFFVSILGSYQAYEFTDSDQFCGTLCHSVMNPEYTAYSASPHARVGCVGCHVGAGATWYVRSKLSGSYQVYAALFNKYPRPIPTPVQNLRPAQQTCEQCHWPEKFFGAQLKVFSHFGYDESNTPRQVQLLIKTGGGSPSGGITAGIHWHMNIANEITYVASDPQRQKIDWVRMKDKSGHVTEFTAQDTKLKPEQIAAAPARRMDCIDCHNRPTHIYVPPDRSIDRALLAGTIDRTLPFVKAQAVEVLSKDYASTSQAIDGIASSLRGYYTTKYPAVYASKRQQVEGAVAKVQNIFRNTRFPEMKVDWRTHPDNIGHLYFSGCFRCHDNQHVSKDGKVISKDCNICHSVLSQEQAGVVMADMPKNSFQHPVDLGDLTQFSCSDCHTGSAMAQ